MSTTTLRLTVQEKRLFAAEARQRGVSLSEFLRQAAHKEVVARDNPWGKFFAEHPPVVMEGPSDLSTREGFSG